MKYKTPPSEPMKRRVYVLPVELIQRVQKYGYENGHQSEVSAVRELLSIALGGQQHDNSK